jgi:hypothetical protein
MLKREHLLAAAVAALLLAVAAPAQAKDEACTDGTNCLCDKISQQDPGVVFCEDFEKASLNQDGTGSGWTDAYGAPTDGCWQKGMPTGEWVKSVEGTCPTCCVNVVKESTCEVPGQTDCVFQGAQTMGHRFHPGTTQGGVGSKSLQTGSNFGVTMAVKYSKNFNMGNGPKKTDEFGPPNHCILGCSSATYVSATIGSPFHGVIFWDTSKAAPTWRDVVGRGGYSGVAFGWYPSIPATYDFYRDHGLDSWHCWKLHISNVGKPSATVRHWIDEKPLVNIADVNLSNMLNAAQGFNNYYNDGYPGTSIAYRYEDNIVITTSSEPVSCAAIGFTGGTTPVLGTPGQPKLVP